MASRPYSQSDLPSFKCNFPGCKATYQRKEHLNRHMALHDRGDRFQCPYCDSALMRRNVPWLFSWEVYESAGTNSHLAIFYVDMFGTTTQGESRRLRGCKKPVELAMREKYAAILNLPASDVKKGGLSVQELTRRRFMTSPQSNLKRLNSSARTW
jgi:hypothetical protein